MTKLVEDRGGQRGIPSLRVFRGDDSAGPTDPDQLGQHSASRQLDVEKEAFWAGRMPAFRISARVAA